MRLRSLSMRNFRRHAESDIEFPDGVTAVLGPNGAGKSTLLEAISFALYGTDALTTNKGLLRHEHAAPADAVSVVLQLEVGGQSIEVLRELRGRAQTPSAQFSIDGTVIVAAGAGSSEVVSHKVQELLGMDREAFHTTVVARQGELSRLADAKPADRKRLVLRMLGIDRLDAGIEKARARRREAEATLAALRAVAPDDKALADEKAKALLDGAEAERLRSLAAARVETTRDAVAAAEAALKSARDAVAAAAQAKQQVGNATAVLGAATQRLARAVQQRSEAETAAGRAAILEPIASQRDALQAQWTLAQESLAKARERALAERRIEALAQRHAQNAAKLAALVVPSASVLEPLAAAVEQAGQRLLEARTAVQSTTREWADLEARAQRLQRLGGDAPCPTCERPLAGHADRLHAEARGQLEMLRARLAAQQVQVAADEAALRNANAALEAGRKTHAEATRIGSERAALAQAIQQDAADLAAARAELPPAAPEPVALDVMRAQRDAANKAHDDWQRVKALAARSADAVAEHVAATTAEAAAQAALAAANAALAATAGADEALRAATTSSVKARAAELDAQAEAQRAGAGATAAAARLAAVTARIAAAQELQVQIKRHEGEATEWAALASARNDGILDRFRDHLVDRIGPAIQAEASRLLAAFTSGRYTDLLLDSDYEVFVRDGATAYSLERYSGGEQDLIHLALRLAVSRLLAQRSGLEVRLLALDEVFGALDQERRGAVVAALHGLSGLYQQVLVVSHLESLQEALDQAIVVVPDGATSRLTVHNG